MESPTPIDAAGRIWVIKTEFRGGGGRKEEENFNLFCGKMGFESFVFEGRDLTLAAQD